MECDDRSRVGEVFAINVKGTFLAVKGCLPAPRESGRVAIVSSVRASASSEAYCNRGRAHATGYL